MRTFLKIFLCVILIIILLIIGVLGYFGFIPGVSSLFGSDKPRDLGVRYTKEDLAKVQTKLGQAVVTPASDPYEQMKSAKGHPVDTLLTQEEYSAHVERVHPVSNVQIKLTGDSFQMSGRIDKARIPQFLRTWGLKGVSDKDILDAVNKYLPVDPIFYLSGSGSVKDNKMTFNIKNAELGRLPVPPDQAKVILEGYSEMFFNQIPGFSVSESNVVNGQLHFKGSVVEEIPQY